MEFTPPGFLKTNLELPFFLRLTAILYFVFTITTAVVKRFWTLRIRVLYKYFDIIILLLLLLLLLLLCYYYYYYYGKIYTSMISTEY